MSARFTITRLGSQGDGIAGADGGEVFIPFTLPGETVTAARQKDRATLMSVVETSPLRVDPPCRHFTECGGCALQHFEADGYRQWKRERVVQALKIKGIAGQIDALVPCAPHTRRRVVFSARRTEAGMLLGFVRALSSEIIPIEECPISLPAIVDALDPLRRLAGLVCATPKAFHMTVTATASGLDVAVHDAGKLGENQRRIASNFVIAAGLARLSIDGEVIVEGDAPALAALDRAFRFASGLKRVTSERRDLFRRPLTFKELSGFDGLVFDPPRAGAEDQSKQIARSDVPLVAAVSCNPTTLARDLRILIDGGYQLKSVTPIDQFLWSPHVEAVALLEKPKRRR
ncbi:MAG: class I SAM-dependent RNA methyltransferase [Mesorhizobium sp.]|uniref:class I SAM-dependent RNA methyltransferase n=1 Tax=Mesorhizobium sp. TaxID=1871066 RepID=UPI000FE6B711|nr:RNA methyltransferase [Mesorhizobium sp.]RWG42199.1 MAG: class I SAM-dependent RNA methyltransferase [Mesorhizobium sp.]